MGLDKNLQLLILGVRSEPKKEPVPFYGTGSQYYSDYRLIILVSVN